MKRCLLLMGLVLCTAYASGSGVEQDRSAVAGTPDLASIEELEIEATSEVLVRGDARLYVRPDHQAHFVQAMRDLSDDALGDRQLFVRLRLIADHGAFVEVATFAGHDEVYQGGSYPRATDDPKMELRFFVAREELVPVIAAPVEKTYDDGTGRELRPGLAVRADAEQAQAGVQIGALQLNVEIPDDALGFAYQPEDRPERKWSGTGLSWEADLRLNGELVDVDPDAGSRYEPQVIRMEESPNGEPIEVVEPGPGGRCQGSLSAYFWRPALCR